MWYVLFIFDILYLNIFQQKTAAVTVSPTVTWWRAAVDVSLCRGLWVLLLLYKYNLLQTGSLVLRCAHQLRGRGYKKLPSLCLKSWNYLFPLPAAKHCIMFILQNNHEGKRPSQHLLLLLILLTPHALTLVVHRRLSLPLLVPAIH